MRRFAAKAVESRLDIPDLNFDDDFAAAFTSRA
jgi:hypothetical protein